MQLRIGAAPRRGHMTNLSSLDNTTSHPLFFFDLRPRCFAFAFGGGVEKTSSGAGADADADAFFAFGGGVE